MKIFTVKGIDVKLHYSSLLIVILVGINAAVFYSALNPTVSQGSLWLFGIAAGIAVIFSIIVHELMHSIMAIHYGLEISEIELFFVGGVSKLKGEPKAASDEIKIAGIGPLSSIVLGVSALGIAYAVGNPLSIVGSFMLYLAEINLVLGFFNLIPAFPMDGGRVLRGILWKKRNNFKSATVTAAKAGNGFGIALMGLGIIQILLGVFSGFITLFIGYFLRNSSKDSVMQAILMEAASRIRIEQVLEGIPPISYNMPVESGRKYFFMYRTPYLPLEYGGKIVGIVRYESVAPLLAQNVPYDMVGNYLIPIEVLPKVKMSDDVVSLIHAIESHPAGIVVVLNESSTAVMGFIERTKLLTALKFAQILP